VLIQFSELVPLTAPEVFDYFHTPADWGRLYGFAGQVADHGDGWYAVPLKRFPFPLIAKITDSQPPRLVRWRFRGFWRGRGEVLLTDQAGGVRIDGYEAISIHWLPGISWLFERLLMEREFRRIWALGWRRLRQP
jgi:polyketide cyclase/dehydrase/lipid transport protein